MNIVFFEVAADEQKFFKSKFPKDSLTFFSGPIQDVDTRKFAKAECLCVFIHSKVTVSIIEKLPRLKLIVTRSTGFDHVAMSSVPVANVPFYGENTVAEHTFGLILSLSRNIHKSHLRTQLNDFTIAGLRGFDLKDKTLGVLGVGHIGLHVIRIAKGFGMHVNAFDLHKDQFISELLHYKYSDIDTILKTSDIITLHMPYNKETHHFLDKKRLSMLKKGAIVINTARGGLIDTDALYDLLQKGHIGGAGLDVIEGEEYIFEEQELLASKKHSEKLQSIFRNKKMFTLENVIFTPHNAFNSSEAVLRILESTCENIIAFQKHGVPKYPVKPR